MKTVVYSCVTGGYDHPNNLLRSPVKATDDLSFILFTDSHEGTVPGDAWSVRPLAWQHPICRRRTARWHKLHSHALFPEADLTIWVDGSQIIQNVGVIVRHHNAPDSQKLSTFKHPQRSCLYQELRACIKLNKDNPALMQEQVERYRDQGYPPFNGLVETACLVRKSCPEVTAFNKQWWEELDQHSYRDQLSFNYVAWSQKLEYGTLAGCRAKSPYFSFVPHNRRK